MSNLIRILIVDDDPADARIGLDAMAEMDLSQHTLVLSDGVQALDFLHARGTFCDRSPGYPAAILLDVKMPKLSGLEVLESIRADPQLRLIPVVMLTASNLDRDVRRAYELGANGYLVKPIDSDACTASLRTFGRFFAEANRPPPGCLAPPQTG